MDPMTLATIIMLSIIMLLCMIGMAVIVFLLWIAWLKRH